MTDNELGGISRRLAELSQTVARIRSAIPGQTEASSTPADDRSLLALADRLIMQRHLRDVTFGQDRDLFGDPGFDVLLWVYTEGLRGRRTATSDPGLAANVRPTTALRWVALLTERGLVTREPDSSDKRRHHVRCTPAGHQLMSLYLQRMEESSTA